MFVAKTHDGCTIATADSIEELIINVDEEYEGNYEPLTARLIDMLYNQGKLDRRDIAVLLHVDKVIWGCVYNK